MTTVNIMRDGKIIKLDASTVENTQTSEQILTEERYQMTCTRAQGKTAIGAEVWAKVLTIADDPEMPWGLKVVVYDAQVWNRLDANMEALIWAMDLTQEQADDLFRLAMGLT
jgi:hypothetical protein